MGIAGIRNVLRHLRMLDGAAAEPPLRFTIRHTHWVRARTGGILDLEVQLGQPLRRGQAICQNTDPFGHGRSRLKAPHGGLVLGLTQLPLVHPGDAVCHLAQLAPEELAAWSEHWARGGGRITT